MLQRNAESPLQPQEAVVKIESVEACHPGLRALRDMV